MAENLDELRAKTMEALREVYDPEIGLNVVELGLIRDLQIEEDKAHVVMMMTTPFCPYAPQLLEQTRRATQQALNRPTTIEMSMEMWTPDLMEDSAAAEWGLL